MHLVKIIQLVSVIQEEEKRGREGNRREEKSSVKGRGRARREEGSTEDPSPELQE